MIVDAALACRYASYTLYTHTHDTPRSTLWILPRAALRPYVRGKELGDAARLGVTQQAGGPEAAAAGA